MTLSDVPKIKFFKIFWILFPRMTLGDIPIFGFCFHDLQILVNDVIYENKHDEIFLADSDHL